MDNILDREMVTEFLRFVFQSCRQIEGKSIKLMPPTADSVYSKGYQIHIEPADSDEIMVACIQKIADSQKLATIKEGQRLIIFNPIKQPQ